MACLAAAALLGLSDDRRRDNQIVVFDRSRDGITCVIARQQHVDRDPGADHHGAEKYGYAGERPASKIEVSARFASESAAVV